MPDATGKLNRAIGDRVIYRTLSRTNSRTTLPQHPDIDKPCDVVIKSDISRVNRWRGIVNDIFSGNLRVAFLG